MKAVVYERYGPPDVLETRELPGPVPKENELLVRVRATSVNYGDLLARTFGLTPPGAFNMPALLWLLARLDFGWKAPRRRILGSEFSGEVVSVGPSVREFRPGDPVFGFTGQRMGAYAGYLCIAEKDAVAAKPTTMSHEEAAVVPMGAIMALGILRKAGIHAGQNVLVLGASGSIGSAAVQIAKGRGARVTGVCGAPRMDFVRALGADQVLDYAKDDFSRNGEKYDLVLDVLGKSSFARCRDSLASRGIYLRASFKTRQLLQMARTSVGHGKRVVCALAPGNKTDLLAVRELIEAGTLKALVDRRFPLERASEAHRYVESGEKRGHVALVVDHENGLPEA